MTPTLTPAARPPFATPTQPPPPLALLGADGQPLRPGQDGWVAPHALNFASVLNTVSKTYSYRWDEALKDSPANALAMRRDAYYLGLLQERVAPTAGLNWHVKVPKSAGNKGEWVKERLTAAVEAVPDLTGFLLNQLEALWYGRAGSQVLPGRAAGGVWTVKRHQPVNGDKIQYGWDGTPVVIVSGRTASEYRDEKGTVVVLDRGGWGLRLDRLEFRERFCIHHHVADDADFFQGEMAGGVHGVGLRSRVYWSGWMRTETLGWMLSFMQGVGMMDLIILNYPSGNPEAKRLAEANAKKITNGLALLVARGAEERGYPAVEQVSLNHAGVKVLQDLISGYFDRHIERLFVGQSMSGGQDGGDGLGGSGRAKFAQDTKFQLLKMDAKRLGETLTRDLLSWMQRRNCAGTEDIPAAFEFAVPDPGAAEKLETGLKLIQAKIPLKAEELRELAGFTKPEEHDEQAGGEQPGAGGMPGQPPPPGRAATPDDGTPGEDDLHPDLLAESGEFETYGGQTDQWQPHTIGAGPRKGQQAYLNPRTGELRDAPPGEQAAKADPNMVQRGMAAVKEKGRAAGAAVSGVIDRVPGGKVIKALGAGAVKVFHAVEKPMMAAMATTQQLARQAAYERGMSDAHVDVLGKVLFVADFAGGYGGAALGYVAAGAVGGKVGSFMPTASVVYLAYSTARDPMATWRAAKRLVRAKLQTAGRAAGAVGGAVAKGVSAAAAGLERVSDLTGRLVGATGFESEAPPEFYALSPDLAGRLADGLRGAHDANWWQACVTAGIGETRDPERAITLASDLADHKPVPDGAEIGAAMIHMATMGDWDAVGALGDEIGGDGGDDAPEQYARTAAKWEPFSHTSGKPAWKSAGGLVRFSDPSAGRAATPEGPNIPHRVLRQRANQDAQRKAVDITNRLAMGHPPGVDELAGLPDMLRSLTSAQLLALNKTVGGHGGKLKADRIAHYIGKVNSTLADTAQKPRPKYGLSLWTAEDQARADAEAKADSPPASKLEDGLRSLNPGSLVVGRSPPQAPAPPVIRSAILPAFTPEQRAEAKRVAADAGKKRADSAAAQGLNVDGTPITPAARPAQPTFGDKVKAVSGRWATLFGRLMGDPERMGEGEIVELVPAPDAEQYAAPGPPPRTGLEWKEETKRWIRPAAATPSPSGGRAAGQTPPTPHPAARTLRTRVAEAVKEMSGKPLKDMGEVAQLALLPNAVDQSKDETRFDARADLSHFGGTGVLLDDAKTSSVERSPSPYYHDKPAERSNKAMEFLGVREGGEACVPSYLVFHSSGIYRCFGFDQREGGQATFWGDMIAFDSDEMSRKLDSRRANNNPMEAFPAAKLMSWPGGSGKGLSAKVASMAKWSHTDWKELEARSTEVLKVVTAKLDDMQDDFDAQAAAAAKVSSEKLASKQPKLFDQVAAAAGYRKMTPEDQAEFEAWKASKGKKA